MKPHTKKFADWVFEHLAGGPEYCTPPGDWLAHEFGQEDDGKPMYTAYTLNDGYELWIAYSHGGKWLVHFRFEDALQLARFIIWDWWVKETWCGLKRKIWYWALGEQVKNDRIRG